MSKGEDLARQLRVPPERAVLAKVEKVISIQARQRAPRRREDNRALESTLYYTRVPLFRYPRVTLSPRRVRERYNPSSQVCIEFAPPFRSPVRFIRRSLHPPRSRGRAGDARSFSINFLFTITKRSRIAGRKTWQLLHRLTEDGRESRVLEDFRIK